MTSLYMYDTRSASAEIMDLYAADNRLMNFEAHSFLSVHDIVYKTSSYGQTLCPYSTRHI